MHTQIRADVVTPCIGCDFPLTVSGACALVSYDTCLLLSELQDYTVNVGRCHVRILDHSPPGGPSPLGSDGRGSYFPPSASAYTTGFMKCSQ